MRLAPGFKAMRIDGRDYIVGPSGVDYIVKEDKDMSNVDWSKAPEGATHYLWWKGEDKNSGEFYIDLGGDRIMTADKSGRYTMRSDLDCWDIEQPKQWNGTGLPPVGAVCEVEPHNTAWGFSTIAPYTGTVLAYHDDFVWIDIGVTGVPVATRIDKVDFRPLRTPEQIATDEREVAIDAMVSVWRRTMGRFAIEEKGLAEMLYDDGYRKQST